MHDRSLDSMASDSYLLKAAPASCPQYPCQSRPVKPRRSTSWRVVVALVLLLVAVVGLAALAYLQRMELLDMRASVANIKREFKDISTNLERLHMYKQFKEWNITVEDNDSDSIYDTSYEDDDDALEPYYSDTEDTNVVEGKARDSGDGARAPVPKLEPASGHHQPVEATTTTSSPEPIMFMDRRRRDVRQAGRQAGRPQPQLKLYHMLQTPGLSAAAPPPEQQWSQYGVRHPQDRPYGPGRPQPMYAERAPMAFVPPPQPPQRHAMGHAMGHAMDYAATTAAPVASRRSRVMDGVGTSPGPGQQQHRRRHHHRLQQRQQGGFQQLQNLQDVTQEVPQSGAARSVESIDGDVEVEQTWRPYAPAVVEGPAIAAHFVGDTARHRGTHHYDDNGRLKHPAGEYADWTASPWVRELGLDHHFKLASTGSHITVDTPGLYLVYAQVNYANDKDENGFWVYRNQQKELLCATAGASGQDVRANTCFTAGVLHLFKGDRVSLKDLAGDRYRVLDHPGRSFVGMVNLSACKLKAEQPSRATA